MSENNNIGGNLSIVNTMDMEASISSIQARIFSVRGVQVMLDRDLAALFVLSA